MDNMNNCIEYIDDVNNFDWKTPQVYKDRENYYIY